MGSDFTAATNGSAAGLLDRKEKSVAQRAYERLLDMLIKREIPVGTVLQERRLAEHLDISRTPVREALGRLESAGFVTRKPGRMLVVKEFSTRELIETLFVRKVLESESAGLATGRIPAAELDAIEAEIHAILVKESPSADEDWAVDNRFHGLIGEYSGNAVLARTIQDLRVKTHMFNMDRVPERFEIGHREHLAVIDALRRGDKAGARLGIETHIDNVKLSIIDKLSRI